MVLFGCANAIPIETYNQLEAELNNLNQQIEVLKAENASLKQEKNEVINHPESSDNVTAKEIWNYCADRQYEYFVAGGMTDSQIEQQAYEDAANHFGISVSEVKRLYQEHAASLSGSSSGTSGKTNKCAQCGKPIYADETWCDDCLFGSIGGSSYDSDYQSNLEDIANAYGVTPEEVDDLIKSVTGK